jgi:hypothetical protein
MAAVWSGFAGVVVGGLITTVWNWLAVVRQELSDAMVSARLVHEDLTNLDEALKATEHPAINSGIWEANRGALARVLGRQQWEEVSAVYKHYVSPVSHDRLRANVAAAQRALKELVDGKRYVIPQRWRNAFSRRRTRTLDRPQG